MGKETEIAWTDATFNPVWGCARVSPGCEHCYAEAFAKRTGHDVWGAKGERRVFGEKHWNEPLKWNAAAAKAGIRKRVFCASMADVFEDHPTVAGERSKLWRLIEQTSWLDWQLLTKRPENIRAMLPPPWLERPLPNLWLGTTTEDQRRADERIPHLLAAPALVRFLSSEPLLGPVDIGAYLPDAGLRSRTSGEWKQAPAIDWVIVGAESGPGARTMEIGWARAIVEQCSAHRTACFVKQLGHRPLARSRYDMSAASFKAADDHGWTEHAGPVTLLLKHPKGGDPEEWPEDLRVRQFPIPFHRP